MLNLNPEVIESTVPQEEVSPLPSDKVKQLFRSVKDRVSLTRRIPRVTYRLQLNHQFSFSRAKAVVAYLKDLGISDVYISPIFKAKKGSVHGYDILSPNLLNPEIGTEEDFQAWLGELRSNGLGQILDIVPNHMSIMGSDNIWWQDILENGPGSIYADFFDINWNPLKSELKNKVLLAILGDQYGRILENQELTLQLQEGSFAVFYNELKLPLDPKSYTRILKFRLPELEEKLDREDPDLNELFSIITALDHLPSQTETSGETVQERRREKEIIKKRIMNLYSESPPIRDFLDENVALFNGRKGMPESFNSLDGLLNEQAYRLSYWRVATDEINYRRFFDVNELAAIKVESSPVFNEIHNLIFRLIRDQAVTGLRVDHPDGLYNPVEYFFRLQKNCFIQYCRQMTAEPTREEAGEAFLDEEDIRQLQTLYDEDLMHNPHSPLRAPFYIVGEKILMNDEKLPEEWPIFGTVGYSFLNSVNGIFVNSENARSFENLYSRFISRALSYDDLVYEKKKLIMQVAMSAEITFLTHFLNHLSEKNRHTRDFTFNSLRMVIREVISFFPVYRTYVNDCGVIERDRRYIEQAVSRAIRKNPAISASIFNFLKSILLLEYPEDLSQSDKRSWLDFVMKLQQVTGPVMAKGVEDTVYYIYNRLISNNEVGGDPEKFGLPLEAFHQENIERSRMWPFSLLASSTHDTKRSEDIRARINVLSESPKEWRRSLTRWARINEKKKTLINGTPAPDANEEYFLYQTLLGSWPLESEDEQRAGEYEARIKETMLKALREAKIHSSWINPETSYEEAVVQFIERLLTPSPTNAFLHNFLPYQSKIAFFGMLNSLSQTLLKMTAPGIPDFYQGTELWDFSLADPDNRRPVDFKIRQDRLRGVMEEIRKGKDPARLGPEFLTSWRDGRIKLYLIFQALDFRRRHEQVFAEGDYLPLYGSGRLKNHLCAFARQKNGKTVITITPRFLSQLLESPETLPLNTVWEDSRLLIPPEISAETFKNILTGETLTVSAWEGARVIFVREALAHFPLALLDSILEPTLKKGSQEQIPLWRD